MIIIRRGATADDVYLYFFQTLKTERKINIEGCGSERARFESFTSIRMNINCTYHDNDSVVQNFFGYGSTMDSGWLLLLCFAIVALYMTVCGFSLNRLESLTYGTSYHLMLQRIYREIMMVGLAAFMWTILNATSTHLPGPAYRAFGFADICSFIMAFFFCLQGVFIMIGSVRQTRIWNEATTMTTKELQYSLSSLLKSSNALMLHPYFPYCRVRDQAEFRVFHSIFSSTYSISTKKHEFDFGMFLRMSHEDNILSIIEIGPEKWLLILLITIAPAMKIEFFESSCKTLECKVTEEIYICVFAGLLNSLLAVFVFFCGRYSELQLLKKAGVMAVSDYDVFLSVEARCRHVLSKNKVTSTMVKDAISEYLVENESIKASKRATRRANIRRQSVVAKSKMLKAFVNTNGSARVEPSTSTSSRRTLPDSPSGGGHITTFPSGEAHLGKDLEAGLSSRSGSASDTDDSYPAPVQSSSYRHAAEKYLNAPPADHMYDVDSVMPFTSSPGKDGIVDPDAQIKIQPSISKTKVIVKRTSTAGEGFVVQTTDTEVIPLNDPPPTRRISIDITAIKANLKKRRSEMMRGSLRKSVRMSFVASKATYKEKLKTTYEKENFSDVFLLQSSELYYGLMSVVITANSLYLAWWITDFLMLILRLKTASDVSYLISISALPFLATFPFLYLAVKSSSILKALCRLKLDIVSAVVEKTESNSALKKNFKSMCLATIVNKADPGPELKVLFDNHSGDGILLTLDEFQELVTASKIHLTEQKLRHLYDTIRPSPNREVTFVVSNHFSMHSHIVSYVCAVCVFVHSLAKSFQNFLLEGGDEEDESDAKLQGLTEQEFKERIDTEEKRTIAVRILDFLDPKALAGIIIE